jgi:hypothetical protein
VVSRPANARALQKLVLILFRHRPLYAGDPVSFFAAKKLDRPDEPGDDDEW